MKILSPDNVRETMEGLLESTRYFPPAFGTADKHGMPVVAPEPDDPDDE